MFIFNNTPVDKMKKRKKEIERKVGLLERELFSINMVLMAKENISARDFLNEQSI